MLRVVLDTNVIVSAVISKGKPRVLLNKGIEGRFQIIVSEHILKELGTVLRRPKFKTGEDEINNIIVTLRRSGDVVTVTSNFRAVKEDPVDDIILNTAYDGKADTIVTGDRHLLVLKRFKRTRIMSVSKALKQF